MGTRERNLFNWDTDEKSAGADTWGGWGKRFIYKKKKEKKKKKKTNPKVRILDERKSLEKNASCHGYGSLEPIKIVGIEPGLRKRLGQEKRTEGNHAKGGY